MCGVLPIHLQLKPFLQVPRAAWEVPRGPASPSRGSLAISGGLHPTSAASLTMARHRYPELGDRGYSGGGSSCSSSSSAARPRLHTLCPQRAPPPPPPARPNGPSTAAARAPPRPAPPRLSRLARSRGTAASFGSLRPFHGVRRVGGRARARAPRHEDYFRSRRALSAPCLRSAFLSGGRAPAGGE